MRRTKEDAQATREQLLEAAERLFLERGLVRTSLQDIAQAAGVTRGAFYWHFTDKVALVQALIDRVDLPLEQASREAETTLAHAPLERLRLMARAPFELIASDLRARRVFTILLHRGEFVGELAALARRHDEAMDDCIGRMQRCFEAAEAAGQLGPGISAAVAATALLALVDGLLRLCTQGEAGGETDGRTAERLCREAPLAIDALITGLAQHGRRA
ncbi:MAG: TetR family transcriptional regulator [Burkholderiaceae bacterium]|nr:TetR family transcriptional regulator [Burkholderiaceae bacterium]